MRWAILFLVFAAPACRRQPEPLRADDARAAPAAPRIVGRSDGNRFAWSGTTIRARFTGPSVVMRLRIEGPDVTPYTVYVDDRPPTTIDAAPSMALAAGLDPAAPHTIRVVREAEAFAGVHELLGLDLGPGGAFLPDKLPAHRLEIIGDSITCGYGVLGDDGKCRFSFATERATSAYGTLTANALDAELTTIAWSGKGAYRNYDGTTTDTMRDLFELAIPAPKAVPWAFAAHPAPDAVVIALGTNDYARPLDEAAFEDAYVKLTERVREVYPAAFVFVTTSPMLSGSRGDAARAHLEHVVARRTAGGDARIEFVAFPTEAAGSPFLNGGGLRGCDHHPDVAMNLAMSGRLIAAIQKRLPR